MDGVPAMYMIRINGHLGAMLPAAFPQMVPRQHGAQPPGARPSIP
jgi:hypothetical protein